MGQAHNRGQRGDRSERSKRADRRAEDGLPAAESPLKRRLPLMGNPRPKPLRLAEKLLQIRKGLGLSQTQMLMRMGLEETMH